MAVHVPVMVVMGALKAVQQQANSRQATQQQMTDLARLKVQSQMLDRQQQREAILKDRQNERESNALLQLATMSKEMASTKIDAVMQIFEGVKEVLLGHQAILGAEKAAISQAELTGTLSGPQQVLRMKRQGEIDLKLAEISAAAMQLGDTAFAVIAKIEGSVDRDINHRIEDLRDV